MTAQFREGLIIGDEKFSLSTTPLSQCISFLKRSNDFEINCTALWRGYVGVWEIIDNRLYLKSITGKLRNGTKASLGYFFPGYDHLVFAHWYSGCLVIAFGDRLKYVHAGFASIYEQERHIYVEQGLVVHEETIRNAVTETTGYD